jgi:hypothetical protein
VNVKKHEKIEPVVDLITFNRVLKTSAMFVVAI